MRKINGKLFLALLVGLAVTGVGLFFLHRVQRGRIASTLLFHAKAADERGESLKASEYRQRYLEFNKNDYEEMANLARQWAGDGLTAPLKARQRAVALLDKVLTNVDDRDLRKLLVKTALGLRDYILAREHLAKLLPLDTMTASLAALRDERAGKIKQAPTPERAEERGLFESYWGQLLEIEKKPQDAMDSYRLAVRHAPTEVLPYVRLAYLLRRRTETDSAARADNVREADGAIDALVKQNNTAADAYLTRWRYRRDFDLLAIRETANKGPVKLEAAAEDIAQALKRKPDSVDVLLCAADLERIRARAASEDPAKTEPQRKAGLKAHRDKAFDYLRRGLEVASRSKTGLSPEESGEFQLLWHKSNLQLDDLDPREPQKIAASRPEIEEVIEQVKKTRIAGAADYLMGRLALIERNWAEAAVLFERARTLLAMQPDLACQADLFLGQCYGRLEEHTQMFNAFKRVSDHDPSSVAARVGMAEARVAQGQLDTARGQFDVLIKQGQMPARAWIDVARLEIQRQMVSERPQWENAENLLRQAEESNPRAIVEIPLMRAEMLMRQDKQDEARKELKNACDRCPDEVDLWAALADCAARRRKPAEAKKILDDAEERVGDKVGLRLARARLIEAGGKIPPEAVERLSGGTQGFTDAEQARLLSGLADACLRVGDAASSRKLYQRLAALPAYKLDLKLHLLLFDLALRERDEAGMEKVLETIKGVEQDAGTYHRYGTALLTIYRAHRATRADERKALLSAAGAELDVVQKVRPSWSSLFLARAEIASLEENPEQAIKNLQDALKNGERSPGVIRKLVGLLTAKGRTDEAQTLMGQLNKAIASGKELSRLAASLAIRSGNVGRALEIARSAIRDDSRDPSELVYMARVLSANRMHDQAEAKIAEALEIAPGDPEANLARVQFLIERKRKDEAVKALAVAAKNVPAAKRALTLARCHDALAQTAEAVKQYAEAAARGKDDAPTLRVVAAAHMAAGRMGLAEPLLRRLLGGALATAATPEDLTWARRNLAMVLAGSTDYRRFTEALDLVGLKLDVNGKLADVDDRNQPSEAVRARARVLAAQSQKAFRDQAIRLFEALDRKGDLAPEDRFVLAMLYEADGRSDRSQKTLRELTQTPLRTPRYLAQYAMSLLVTRRDPDALAEVEQTVQQLAELEKLREVGPNGFASVELNVRLLEARKEDAKARDLMKAHVTRPGARPEEALLLIGTLSRQKRFDEAYAVCEATWEKGECAPEQLGAVAVSLLRVMGPTDSRIEAVEKRLRKALAAEKPGNVLRMQLADLLDRRGKYADAAAQWREVLKAEPNNFVAMNNLAWQIMTQGGDAAEALGYIDKAMTGMGRRADLLDTRGLVYLAMKDTGKALADFKEAAADGPTPTRLLHLARAQFLAKDREAAKEALQKAMAAGLEVAKLHPTEQEQAKQLLADCGL